MPSLTLGGWIIGVLLYFTDKSWPLSCEVCRDASDNCFGPKQVCYPILDMCGTFQSKNFKSGKYITRKSCVQANICNGNITSVDLGENGILSTRLTCCTGAACAKPLTPLPPVNTTPNGKKCKTCFAERQTYCLYYDTIPCKGDQTYCLQLAGQADWGGFGTVDSHDEMYFMKSFAMKGCVNPNFCELFHEGSVYFSTFFLMGEGSCKPASAKVATLPSYTVVFFQMFAGFLLAEIYA